MFNRRLKDFIAAHVLPHVQQPLQYLGHERNAVSKDHRGVRGTLCLAFPDVYSIGMSHHGLQVLYSLMNAREDWACERVFAPWHDMEQRLREQGAPLYGLESFTPLSRFDVVGFSLQYEISFANILTMLDLGGIPLRSVDRTLDDPLVIAGGPCAQNPEPVAPFLDVVVTGDGEPSLPVLCDKWLELKRAAGGRAGAPGSAAAREQREELLAELAARLPFAYVPRFYEAEYLADGTLAAVHRTRPDVPDAIEPAVISDLEAIPLPTAPVVPYVECVHDRIAIEIMRGCPWQCRFCQSTVIKRPLRIRSVDTIVQAALQSYRNTGMDEISLLSLSTSDYPHFEQLVRRMQETFHPLGVKIALPSLRVNEQLRSMAALMEADRGGLTLAPEVARDDMREQIRKKISNEDLYVGCREAFQRGWRSVKLYFLCGLPGERRVDLDGIVDMANTIARIGKGVMGQYPRVTASVSNFVPKPHTPYQWDPMETEAAFKETHWYLRRLPRVGGVSVKCHELETSLLEGVLTRGDRRVAEAIELAWRRGARLDGWREHFKPRLWRQALADVGLSLEATAHRRYAHSDRLPWDHLNVRKGRTWLEKEHDRSVVQLQALAGAT